MKDLIRKKARLVSNDVGVAVEFDDNAVDSFLDIAYTNLGVRSVTNRIKKLVCKAISTVYYDDDFDKSEAMVLIGSPDDAVIGVTVNGSFFEFMDQLPSFNPFA